MSDPLTEALGSVSGRLAEILLIKLTRREGDPEFQIGMRERFNKLVRAPGQSGMYARVRLAAEVSLLFERVPEWTKATIIPLFDWSSPDAQAAWAARRYSRYIGSPKLFEMTKESFLRLFGMQEVQEDELNEYAGWLATILLANQSGEGGYPITTTEARSALRRAGTRALVGFAHRLAVEMERAKPDEKIAKWREVVGAVFQNVWPLDAELQAADTSFKLVQILLATGDAFPEAVDVVVPFIRPENPRRDTTVFSIAEASELIYSLSPAKVLDLLAAVVGELSASNVFGLAKALERVRTHSSAVAETRKFQKLVQLVSGA